MINIIYEDNHLLVVEKPINIPVQADASNDKDLLTLLKEYIKNKYNKPGNVYLGLVHRLDRPVGGVMVFAKTSKAASRLSEQVRCHKLKKCLNRIISDLGIFQLLSASGRPVSASRMAVMKPNPPALSAASQFTSPRTTAPVPM